MERRQFLGSCAALTGAGGLSALSAWADGAPRFYDRCALVDSLGDPLPVRGVKGETNYVSRVGRTKTAPAAEADVAIKFAYVSCQDYIGRYYNTYAQIGRAHV